MEILTVKEAAAILGVTPGNIRVYIRKGDLKAVRSDPYMIARVDLDAWQAARPGQGARTDLRAKEEGVE